MGASDSVKLISIHKAKGLQFDAVFVSDIADRSFPSGRGDGNEYRYEPGKVISIKGEEEKDPLRKDDEELRLFYVAMTRAKNRLVLTGSRNKKNAVSEFMGMFVDAGLKLNAGFEGLVSQLTALPPEVEPLKKSGGAAAAELVLPDFEAVSKPQRQKEPAIMKEKHFSVSEIALYLNCPKKYRFSHVLNLPEDLYHAGTGRDGAEFEPDLIGNVMHGVLLEWVRDRMAGKKGGRPDFKKKFIAEFSACGKKVTDSGLLYENKIKQMMKDFVKNEINNPPEAVALEEQFCLFVEGNQIRGTIDRIDKYGDAYHIIDYKTGKKYSAELQLTVYKWGAEKVLGFKPVNKMS
jgi:CRISPR/Cas system-associated exonuclease Cas4 (RecB family)